MITGETIGDLSAAARGETHADLLAGSAGYQHFLQQLSGFISPAEAQETRRRFRRGWKAMGLTTLAFIVLYVAINQVLGPRGLQAAAWGNDALRAGLFIAAVVLVRRMGVSVAGQMLLPLASLCFLPMAVTAKPDWWRGPLIFGGILLLLFVAGWCLDGGAEQRKGMFVWWRRWLSRVAVGLFLLLNLVAYFWILDHATLPWFSVAAGVVALVLLELSGGFGSEPTDVDFLYTTSWKRWRFFISGRALAIILGIVPFLLFANLLDYQEEMERCLAVDKTPDILRMADSVEKWEAYYWRQEGRFLSENDFTGGEEKAPFVRRLYLPYPSDLTAPDSPDLPAECRGDANRITLPPDYDPQAAQADMLALNGKRMTREAFLGAAGKFEALRITSRCRLLRRTLDASQHHFVEISFQQTGPDDGVCFAELASMGMYSPGKIRNLLDSYSVPKWMFFVYGVFGFVFLWRRGGDSSLARWVGIWLVGVSLVPTMTTSGDTLPHLTDWLWRHSVMYHWNTLASATQPLFNLLFFATASAAILWMMQMSMAVCWTYVCWPTRISPKRPAAMRNLIVAGKLAAVLLVNLILFVIVYTVFDIIYPESQGLVYYIAFISINTALFLVVGWVLRKFTRLASEVPRLGALPAVAIVTLNLSVMFYAPVLLFDARDYSATLSVLGAACGCGFILLLGYMILKQDFLRVRAISSFTTLLLVLLVPLLVNKAESFIPDFLTSGPFFRERGAEMVSIMLVVLAFPWLHRQLHELLLAISVPKLRHIEHRVEHAMEEIADAQDDAERAHLMSELFEQLQVLHYLFLSRRPKGLFVLDMNKLGKDVPESVELSEPLRKFLGGRRNFVDLQCMAFEWPFFFHQFELFRLAQKTGCRFLLPVLVGESLRGLLLLPDEPGGSVVSNPAVSANINNFGIAAALSRPGR